MTFSGFASISGVPFFRRWGYSCRRGLSLTTSLQVVRTLGSGGEADRRVLVEHCAVSFLRRLMTCLAGTTQGRARRRRKSAEAVAERQAQLQLALHFHAGPVGEPEGRAVGVGASEVGRILDVLDECLVGGAGLPDDAQAPSVALREALPDPEAVDAWQLRGRTALPGSSTNCQTRLNGSPTSSVSAALCPCAPPLTTVIPS